MVAIATRKERTNKALGVHRILAVLAAGNMVKQLLAKLRALQAFSGNIVAAFLAVEEVNHFKKVFV